MIPVQYANLSEIHNDDLGPVIGTFRKVGIDGLPIRGWNPEDSLTRLSKMLALDLEMRRQLNMTEINSAEVLPGEEICNDSIVRRSTTAEAMGEAAFQAAQLAQPGRKVTIEEARI